MIELPTRRSNSPELIASSPLLPRIRSSAPNTIRNHYIAVNKVFTFAVKHRIIAHNPCPAVVLPRMAHRDTFKPVFLTIAEVEAVAAEVDRHAPGSQYGLLIRFAANTGLRAAEIAGLRIRDLNLSAGHVEV